MDKKKEMTMPNRTQRGFRIENFTDSNGVKCSLQVSSAARQEPLVWLGCDEIGLKRFRPGYGWMDVTLEEPNLSGIVHTANTRMHLSQSQVRDLLPALQHFAEHGDLPEQP